MSRSQSGNTKPRLVPPKIQTTRTTTFASGQSPEGWSVVVARPPTDPSSPFIATDEARSGVPDTNSLQYARNQLHSKHGHDWTPIATIDEGAIFWAPLKLEYFNDVYNCLYLVVKRMSYRKVRGKFGYALAVVGSETNGGYGKTCYVEDNQRYVKDIKLHNTGLDKDGDKHAFYVVDGTQSGNRWKPQDYTVTDMMNVFTIRCPNDDLDQIFCCQAGKLTAESIGKVNDCYAALRSMKNYSSLMTQRTQKQKFDSKTVPCTCCYCEAGKSSSCPFPTRIRDKGPSLPKDINRGTIVRIFRPTAMVISTLTL